MIGARDVTIAMEYSTSSMQRTRFACKPSMHFSRKTLTTFASRRSDSRRECERTGIITFSSKFPLAAAQVIVVSLPMTRAQTCITLIPALDALRCALAAKSQEFWDVIKIGRTHLMDATPVRLGQEFGGYARQCELGVERVRAAIREVEELPIGGTAVGTGLNCHPDFPGIVAKILSSTTGNEFREAKDHFEAQSAKDGLVQASGQLKTIAVSLFKIANDIRWLGSGPRCGIGEILLPETQPGSSIMPGKVNPVICESVMQVCARVIGNDTTVTWAAANGNFELNVMMPVLSYSLQIGRAHV